MNYNVLRSNQSSFSKKYRTAIRSIVAIVVSFSALNSSTPQEVFRFRIFEEIMGCEMQGRIEEISEWHSSHQLVAIERATLICWLFDWLFVVRLFSDANWGLCGWGMSAIVVSFSSICCYLSVKYSWGRIFRPTLECQSCPPMKHNYNISLTWMQATTPGVSTCQPKKS